MEMSINHRTEAETAHLFLLYCSDVALLQIKASIYLWTMSMLHADAQAISQKVTQIRALREWKSRSAAGPGPQTGANICHKTQHKVGKSTKGEAVIRRQTQDYNSLHLFGKQWVSRKGRTSTLDTSFTEVFEL